MTPMSILLLSETFSKITPILVSIMITNLLEPVLLIQLFPTV